MRAFFVVGLLIVLYCVLSFFLSPPPHDAEAEIIYATKHQPASLLKYTSNSKQPPLFLDTRKPEFGTGRAVSNDLEGLLLVSNGKSNEVFRYTTSGNRRGTFISAKSGGLLDPFHMTYGPDLHLYVCGIQSKRVHKYDGKTGAFISLFGEELPGVASIVFGPDGHAYVATYKESSVIKLDGTTGKKLALFVPPESGGLNEATDLLFGPDGNLYVASYWTSSVKMYDGKTGAYIRDFVKSKSGGVYKIDGLEFLKNGDLCVAAVENHSVIIYDSNGHHKRSLPSAGKYFMTDVHIMTDWKKKYAIPKPPKR